MTFEVPTKSPILYPLAITKDSAQPEEARRFQAFVLAPEGQEVLARRIPWRAGIRAS